jgi:hypothetical protein
MNQFKGTAFRTFSSTRRAASRLFDTSTSQPASSTAGSLAASAPAVPFVNRFIAKNGRWLCPRCDATVRTFELPHDCRTFKGVHP